MTICEVTVPIFARSAPTESDAASILCMTEKRSVELYELYTEHGHRGDREARTYYRLIFIGVARETTATLEVEEVQSSFPDDGEEAVTISRHQIAAEKIVQFVVENGTRIQGTGTTITQKT